jgi:hypothetical protein
MALSGHEFNTRTLPAWAAHPNGIEKMGRSMGRAAALADVAIAEPLNDTVEAAGLEPLRMDDLIRLLACLDAESVVQRVLLLPKLPKAD